MSTTPTTTTTITIPIDPATSSGWEAVRYLLRTGLSTPEQIADVLDGVSLIDGCVVQDDAPWVARDESATEVEYAHDEYTTAEEVASAYVNDGDWGDDLSGCVDVSVWRVGLDSDGDDWPVEDGGGSVDLAHVLDHGPAIRSVMGDAGCGDSPDDHEWTSEGEGGSAANPGVWSVGGTGLSVSSHCRVCGLRREEYFPGSQRDPGEGDEVRYLAPDEE